MRHKIDLVENDRPALFLRFDEFGVFENRLAGFESSSSENLGFFNLFTNRNDRRFFAEVFLRNIFCKLCLARTGFSLKKNRRALHEVGENFANKLGAGFGFGEAVARKVSLHAPDLSSTQHVYRSLIKLKPL